MSVENSSLAVLILALSNSAQRYIFMLYEPNGKRCFAVRNRKRSLVDSAKLNGQMTDQIHEQTPLGLVHLTCPFISC